MRAKQFIPNDSDAMHESVAGPEKCWPGHRKVGTQPGTGKNAGKRVNDCEKIGEENKGLYYNVNKRKAAGTSRPASSPKAPTAQAWKDAAKTAKNEDVAEGSDHSLKKVWDRYSKHLMAGRGYHTDIRQIHKSGEILQNIRKYVRDHHGQKAVDDMERYAEKQQWNEGVAEGNYDRDDYYNARRGSEYGRGLAATGYGGDGSATRRDDIFKGQSKRLPADPFARTSGAVPTAGTGRIHSTALPGEMEEGEKIGNMDADRFDDAMARLKKLAGAGPMKTVYDPDRRVYRNMPTAQQPPQQPKK